jgi:drug/metabolite transporter (DMT)-like permease
MAAPTDEIDSMNGSATVLAPAPPALAAVARRDLLSPVELTVLAAIWGGSFMLQRVAVPEFGALVLAELRLLFGALVLAPFLWPARRQLWRARWRLALIGLLNSALPFTLFAWGAERAPAAIGAITNSMAALFAVVVAWMMFGERIGWWRSLGLLAGFAGVIVLVGARDAGLGVAPAAVAGVLAALCYGLAGNLVRRLLAGLPPVACAAATLAWSALLVAPLAIVWWPQAMPSSTAWLAAVTLGVVCTGAAYALYFRLMQRLGPTRAATVTYLVPLFAVAWAWLLLGEPLTPVMAVAGTLILGGVALNQLGRPAAAPAPAPPR